MYDQNGLKYQQPYPLDRTYLYSPFKGILPGSTFGVVLQVPTLLFLTMRMMMRTRAVILQYSPTTKWKLQLLRRGRAGCFGPYHVLTAPKISPAPTCQSKKLYPSPAITFSEFRCCFVRIHMNVIFRQLFHWNKRKVLLLRLQHLQNPMLHQLKNPWQLQYIEFLSGLQSTWRVDKLCILTYHQGMEGCLC